MTLRGMATSEEHMEKRQEFGLAIRQVRHQQGMSQEQLALKSGTDRSYMGRIERGEQSLTLDKMWDIADALDTDPGRLIDLGIHTKNMPKHKHDRESLPDIFADGTGDAPNDGDAAGTDAAVQESGTDDAAQGSGSNAPMVNVPDSEETTNAVRESDRRPRNVPDSEETTHHRSGPHRGDEAQDTATDASSPKQV